MKLRKLKNDYKKGKISKSDYITGMHKQHKFLFDYMDFIKNTDIKKIEISDDSVIMTTRSANIKLICDKDDKRIIPIEILNFDYYEKEVYDIILSLIDNDFNIFDIGANIGWYSINIAKSDKHANIFTFEPIPKTYDYLIKNLSLNNITNVNPYNFGFSDKNQELVFYYYAEGSGNASLANLSELADVEKILCEVKRLDDFVALNKTKIDFLKCDVEGAELFVFQGGIETVKRDKPIIFVELLRKWAAKFNYNPNEVICLLRGAGYRCFIAEQGKLKEFYSMDDETKETNYFFLHNEKHKDKINKFIYKGD